MFLSTKNKTLLFVGVIFGVFLLVLIGVIYLDQKTKLAKVEQAYFVSLKQSYEKILLKQKEFYYNRTLANISSQGVIETFGERNREKLYELSSGRWKTLQKENRYLNVMHFHLPDGTTFLRMHDKEHYGDDVASFRPMIAQIHKTHKGVSGFEMGRQGLAFRIAEPIFKEGQYLGALEFGSRPEQIFDDMNYYNDLHGALFVKYTDIPHKQPSSELRVQGYDLQYDSLNHPRLLRAIFKTGYSFIPKQTFEFEGRVYNVCAFDLYDFEGEISAKALFFQDITPIIDEFKATILKLILFVFGLFVLVLLFINVGFKKIITALDKAHRDLQKNQNFMQLILDHSAHAIITTDKSGIITLFNAKAESMLGYSAHELVGKLTPGLFHKRSEMEQRAVEFSQRFGKTIHPNFEVFVEKTNQGLENDDEWIYITKFDREFSVHLHITALRDKNGEIIGYMGMAEDISESKVLERKQTEYLKLIDENIITSSTDLDGNITYSSEAFCQISGYSKEELLGHNHRIVRHEEMADKIYEQMWGKLNNNEMWEGELKNRTKEGGYYWVHAKIYPIYSETGEKYGYTAIRQDITDKKRVEEISITDALTSIYNRRYFNEVFPNYLKSARRNQDIACFILMDVDHFKLYNDTYGHQMGDDVLVRVAQCIKNTLRRADDYCFRLGGEEFGVLFKSDSGANASEFAETLRHNIENLAIVHEKNSTNAYVTVSMGMAVLELDTDLSCDALYKHSDELLYRAKELGRNRICTTMCANTSKS